MDNISNLKTKEQWLKEHKGHDIKEGECKLTEQAVIKAKFCETCKSIFINRITNEEKKVGKSRTK